MRIPKSGQASTAFVREFVPFDSARNAFRAVLARVCVGDRRTVLLPAYIGWSPKEGSGIFDPVRELDLPFGLYGMTRRLDVDVPSFTRALETYQPAVVLLVHYFGYVDPNYLELVRRARAAGAFVIEDSAHAMFTDLVSGSCGRRGDATLLSLHKMLPVPRGGGVLVGARGRDRLESLPREGDLAPWSWDLTSLAQIRIANARRLSGLLEGLAGHVDLLRPFDADIVPQTLPVLIHTTNRDALYEKMNAAGFGVVSLYHTMIDAISSAEFAVSHEVARTICNLPVHQDVDAASMDEMVQALAQFTRG